MNGWVVIAAVGLGLAGLGLVVGWLLAGKERREAAAGICRAALGRAARKQEKKEKVVKLLAERGELANADIREALGVSARTVVRYLDELERENRVEQTGQTGQAVTYKLKQG